MLDLNRRRMKIQTLDFKSIARIALQRADRLVPRWLPQGRRQGREWVACNPRRTDRHLGSFSINLETGRWADFATGEGGQDLVALRAYLDGSSQGMAARRISEELGL